ncbi:MAG: molybdopterin molybdotransferase MoeA, partial [Gemmatimonadota bacterium]
VPEGADGVVRVEHTDGGSDAAVRIVSDSDAGSNIRRRGEDLRRGEVVLRRGAVLRAAEIGVLASVGRSRVDVVRRPTVAVLASGEELVDLDGFAEVVAGRRIVSTNTYSLAAQLEESGMRTRLLGIAKDSPGSLREHLQRARGCDALVTTGGISVGAHDYTTDVLGGFGLGLVFWRARIRPGSPLAFGRVRGLGGIPWFGLPGNPVSTMVTFEVFVRPALLRMAGHDAVFAPTVRARLAEDYSAKPGLTHFVRVRLERVGAALGEPDAAGPERAEAAEEAAGRGGRTAPVEWVASLTGAQGSGILSSMARADGLLVLPADRTDAKAGEVFDVMMLGGARRD